MKNSLNIHEHALSGYVELVVLEDLFYPIHINQMKALEYYSDSSVPEAAFKVSMPKLMRFPRIRSIAAYHKNIRNLCHTVTLNIYPPGTRSVAVWSVIIGSK